MDGIIVVGIVGIEGMLGSEDGNGGRVRIGGSAAFGLGRGGILVGNGLGWGSVTVGIEGNGGIGKLGMVGMLVWRRFRAPTLPLIMLTNVTPTMK